MLFNLTPGVKAVHFNTQKRGVITARSVAPGRYTEVSLSLPISEAPTPSADAAATFGPVFSRAAGIKPEDFVQFAVIEHGEGVIAEVSPEVDLKALAIDTAKLLPELKHHGVLTQVTGNGPDGVRINSRVFVPAVGIPEDPVVSSARTRRRRIERTRRS